MRFFTGCLFSACLLCASVNLFAQITPSSIRGRVFNENNIPADGATLVLLRTADSVVVKAVITDKNGQFRFVNIQPDSYLIIVSKVGSSKIHTGPYQLLPGKNLSISDIVLQSATHELNEISIIGKKDYIETHADKTVLNIEQNILASGSSVFDILNTAPGVKVINDAILFKGGQKPLFAINGKPVTLTDEQLTGMLKSLQSNMISRVELIDNPSSKYDAANGGGMINIVLKQSKVLGMSTGITESVSGGSDYKFNSGINWNLHSEKFNLFASYSFSGSKIPHTINSVRNVTVDGHISSFALDYFAATITRMHTFNIGADYQLSPKQNVGFFVNGYVNPSDINKKNTTAISTGNVPDSSIRTTSAIDRDISNFNYNLNYKLGLGSSGKSSLTANLDHSDYNRGSSELLQSNFFNAAGQEDTPPIFFVDGSPSKIHIWAESIDFSTPLSKISSLDAGFKNSQVNSDNRIDFSQKLGAVYQPIPSLTDHFVYHEQISSGYFSLNNRFDKTSLVFGLRGEEARSSAMSINPDKTTARNYFDLFPTLKISTPLDAENELSFTYRRSIQRQVYSDLNPFVRFIDQFYYSTGNPFLKPEYHNTFSLTDLIQKKYRVGLSMLITKDFFFTVFEQDTAHNAYVTTTRNLGTRYQYQAELLNCPIDVASWWSANIYFKAAYERYVYSIGNALQRSTWDVVMNIDQSFKITPRLSAEAFATYETAAYFAISRYKPLYFANAGLSYSVLNKKGNVRLVATDIFNTDNNRYHTNFGNLDLTSKDKRGSRFVTLSFSYTFGNSSIKQGQRTNNDEQRRLSGGNEN